MGIITLFAPATSVGSIFELLIYLGVTVLTYWGLQRIVTGAGYAYAWMALPASTMFLTWICYIIFWSDIHGIYFGSGFDFGFSGISQVNVFWTLDEISIVLNWLFFLLIAFSGSQLTNRFTRPSAGSLAPPPDPGQPARPMPPSAAGPVSATRLAPPSAAGPGAGPVSTARPMPPSAAGPGTAPAGAAPPRPGAQFCAWCGESLPGNRALFHDCGPRDRPETNCKNCGAPFPAGTTTCVSCAPS